MAHYAKVLDGKVLSVIVADETFFETFIDSSPGEWIQTSYNTRGGVHYGEDGEPDGKPALRKNFAGVGMIYDKDRDAFYPGKTHPSWTLDEETCWWVAPVPRPETGMWNWDEQQQKWVIDQSFKDTNPDYTHPDL